MEWPLSSLTLLGLRGGEECVCVCVCVCSCTTPNFCRAADSIDQMLDKLLEYVDDVIVSQTVCGQCHCESDSMWTMSDFFISLYHTSLSSPTYFLALPYILLPPFPLLLPFFYLSFLLSSPPKKTPLLPSSTSLLSSLPASPPPLPVLLPCPQAGKIPPNSTVGRLLMEMVSRVPKIEGPKFDSMLNATMQVSITWCSTNLHDRLPYFFE